MKLILTIIIILTITLAITALILADIVGFIYPMFSPQWENGYAIGIVALGVLIGAFFLLYSLKL